MRSETLIVYSRPGAEGKTTQEMHAYKNVSFTFYRPTGEIIRGLATVVKYNQESEQIIFEGTDTNRAILQRLPGPNTAPVEELKGTRIVYNRKTGLFNLYGVTSIEGKSK
jgi:hypothetical protein